MGTPDRPRRILKRIALVVAAALVLILLVVAAGAFWVHGQLQASLPSLEGEIAIEGLSAPVTVERDELGVPTISGADRVDVARATGFVHAQERFFQMDLLRRAAAGELAALIGPALLPTDRRARVHRFREVARRAWDDTGVENRRLVEAYTAGVNAGLARLGAVPAEYLLLRATPEPWRPEDVTLVVLAMYVDLQDDRGRRESNLGLMYDLLPRELVEFLAPDGTEWDAPLLGRPFAPGAIPPPEIYDLRGSAPDPTAHRRDEETAPVPGSNNWAVAGSHTADGGALIANDMHLPHAMPNIWYRASLAWDGHRVTGVMLPGAPPMIVGSNGRVAWGFTNSQGDYSDLVLLEPHGEDGYLTPEGPRTIEHHQEILQVQGAESETLDVPWTIWGPIVDTDHRGRRRVFRWVAHDVNGSNLGLLRLETAGDLDSALEIATRTAIPTQNVVIADADGRIGWTLIGPIPHRRGFDGRVPVSWADGSAAWDGFLPPEEHPRIVDPASGRLWTANNRVVGGGMLRRIGNGGFALGARARQIRDGLLERDRATVEDMLSVQLDDRALFLERWRDLLLRTLTPEAVAGHERRRELRELIEREWSGRAAVDSAAYRMVRAFRLFLAEQVFDAITGPCREADDRFGLIRFQGEGPLWQLVTERPRHLLSPSFESWDGQLLSGVDAVIERFAAGEESVLADHTWGERNRVAIRHPISQAVPLLARWLDVPTRALPGDSNMPRVQSVRFGASMRMVVSPGREASGLFHMPGGQSGHPRSPHYRAGHDAWADGVATPFLPGAAAHRLTLVPAS